MLKKSGFMLLILALGLVIVNKAAFGSETIQPAYFDETVRQASINSCKFGGIWSARYGEYVETGFGCDENAKLEGTQIGFENVGESPVSVTKEVPHGHYGLLWGTTLLIDGADSSGAQVNFLSPGSYELSQWSWGTFLLLEPIPAPTSTPTPTGTSTAIPTVTATPTSTPMPIARTLSERNSVAQARINQCIYPHPVGWEALVGNVSYGRYACAPSALEGNIVRSGAFEGEGKTLSLDISSECHALFWGEDSRVVTISQEFNILRNSVHVFEGPNYITLRHIKWGAFFVICGEQKMFLPLVTN